MPKVVVYIATMASGNTYMMVTRAMSAIMAILNCVLPLMALMSCAFIYLA